MGINPNYKKPKVSSGELKTPVIFYEYVPNDGPEPGDIEERELFRTMCEAYNPSMKDMEILNATGTKMGLTINIRDPLSTFQPNNKHVVEVQDLMFVDNNRWEIVTVQGNTQDHRLLKIILKATE